MGMGYMNLMLVEALALEEEMYALVGGRPWFEFVRRCEYELGLPWAVIREEFDRVPTQTALPSPKDTR